MNFSDSTYEALSAYEEYFYKATKGDWCNNPGRTALTIMHNALDQHDGIITPLNHNCGTCLLRIVRRCGFMYYADKEERAIQAKRDAIQVTKAPKKPRTTKARKDE